MINLTPLFKIYANRRYARLKKEDPVAVQEKQLFSMLNAARNTVFGRQYDFAGIRTAEEFQKRVPLRKYEDFWDEYWKPRFPVIDDCTWPGRVPYFPVSSGTTSGKTKYIPYSKAMQKSNTIAGLDTIVHHLANRPKSRILGGKNFVLGGSTDLVEEAPGIFSGDLSGIAAKTLPLWVKPLYFPPQKLALIKNWEEKIEVLARESLRQDIRLLSGVPSWMLIFIKKLTELKPSAGGKLAGIYPNLEMIIHGGVNFAPYLGQFTDLLEGSGAELREVYPASEGFIAMADRGYGEGMRMVCDHGIFYEFVPLEELDKPSPVRHWAKTAETGVNYALIMSTCAGLWSYIIGDTVKLVSRSPLRLLVTGRTSYYLSAFGEHLAGEEVEEAVAESAREIGESVVDYSMGALYPKESGQLGGHLLIAEFSSAPDPRKISEFENSVKNRLCALNEDYEAHLAGGYGLNPPRVWPARPGMFAAWMKKRGKLGGQNKVPRIITDQELFEDLQRFYSMFSDKD